MQFTGALDLVYWALVNPPWALVNPPRVDWSIASSLFLPAVLLRPSIIADHVVTAFGVSTYVT